MGDIKEEIKDLAESIKDQIVLVEKTDTYVS